MGKRFLASGAFAPARGGRMFEQLNESEVIYMIKNSTQLFELFKPSLGVLKKDDRFFELEDKPDGWSNGYIADFNNRELMKGQALIKKANISDISGKKPKVESLIPDGDHEVESIEFDLASKSAVLKNDTVKASVNPKFLAYFQKVYENMGGISKLVLTEPLRPVKVFVGIDDERLVGLIMPIRSEV